MPAPPDVFTLREIARAAGVRPGQVRAWVDAARVPVFRGFVRQADAVSLVRDLSASRAGSDRHQTLVGHERRSQRRIVSLFGSGVLHGLLIAALGVLASLGLLTPDQTDQRVLPQTAPHRLVFLMAPGPGGGGGGGGLQMPSPPPAAKRKAPAPEPPRPAAPTMPLPAPRPLPPVLSVVVPRRPETPAIARVAVPLPAPIAPIAPAPAAAANVTGLPIANPPSSDPSQGSGTGGGAGTGAGAGLGGGNGPGVGPGEGGGAGGGVFQPGSGVAAPVLRREVKPLYTDDARKRGIAGDVVLEAMVRQDGTVGSVRVTHGLGAGLDQQAIDAVRQWRFDPARRHGVPVDVVVEISVAFSVR